jgi:hypothetical protein
MLLTRDWAMPSPQTFSVKPIKALVEEWIAKVGGVSLDPFARDTTYATHRNDINPASAAEHHMDAYEFLLTMEAQGVRPGLVLFDPPYSPRQAADCYAAAGVDPKLLDAVRQRKGNAWQRTKNWSEEKDTIARMQSVGGVVLSFGWDSNGMGKKRGYQIEAIKLVCHGACHNDTICTVERRIAV